MELHNWNDTYEWSQSFINDWKNMTTATVSKTIRQNDLNANSIVFNWIKCPNKHNFDSTNFWVFYKYVCLKIRKTIEQLFSNHGVVLFRTYSDIKIHFQTLEKIVWSFILMELFTDRFGVFRQLSLLLLVPCHVEVEHYEKFFRFGLDFAELQYPIFQ